jgi:hypothetical protein
MANKFEKRTQFHNPTLKKSMNFALQFVTKLTGQEVVEVFLNDGVRGQRTIDGPGSLVVFTDSVAVEFHSFPSLDTWDAMNLSADINRIFTTRSVGDKVELTVQLEKRSGLVLMLRGLDEDTEVLDAIVKAVLVPLVVENY